MRWPFVSRRALEQAFTTHICARDQQDFRIADLKAAIAQRDADYATLLEKYHALRMQGANAPEPVPPVIAFPEPDVPPDVVLAAMKTISPVPDKTYEANWQHWERNKEKAAAYPNEFAQEIIEGAAFGGIE